MAQLESLFHNISGIEHAIQIVEILTHRSYVRQLENVICILNEFDREKGIDFIRMLFYYSRRTWENSTIDTN